MAVADDKQASALGWLKRLWPLLLLLAAMALVFAMGWHRYLTLQELVERREALRASIAGHTRPRHPCLHGDLRRDRRSVLAGRCGAHPCRRLPVRVVLGRARLGCSRHHRRHRHLPHRPERPWRAARRPGRPLAFEAARRVSRRMLSAISCSCASCPSSRFGSSISPRRFLAWGFGTYALATVIGIIPGSFAYSIAGKGLDSLIVAQQAAHQSCLAKMGSDAEELCPFVLEPGALLTPGLIAGFVALGLVALIPIAVKRFRRKPV